MGGWGGGTRCGSLCREGITALNANRDYSADLWAIINEPRGEIFHPLFLRKHSSYTEINKKVSPPINSDFHSLQSLNEKGTTWYTTPIIAATSSLYMTTRGLLIWGRVAGSRFQYVLHFQRGEGYKRISCSIFISANRIII